MGWSGRKNGELLRSMIGQKFDVLITVDQNLRYQQNMRAAGVAVVILHASGSRFSDLLPLVPSVLKVLGSVGPGDVFEVIS